MKQIDIETHDGKTFDGIAELRTALDPDQFSHTQRPDQSSNTGGGLVMISSFGPEIHRPYVEVELSYPEASKDSDYVEALLELRQALGFSKVNYIAGNDADGNPYYADYELLFGPDEEDKDFDAPRVNHTEHTATVTFHWMAYLEQVTSMVCVDEEEEKETEAMVAAPLDMTRSVIKSMPCGGRWDPQHGNAEFQIGLYDGLVCVDKNGNITHDDYGTHDKGFVETVEDLVEIIKNEKKDVSYLFTCNRCEDETGATVFFEDGTATDDEEKAFRKAFMGEEPSEETPEDKPVVAKVTTAACVQAIVHFLGASGWASDDLKNSKNWKRASKSGADDHCVRTFKNKKDDSILMTVVSAGDRIQGVAWDKNQTLKDAQIAAVSKMTGASAKEIDDMAKELKDNYEPCGSCGVMLKKGVMATCAKCGGLACKRCLLEEETEVRDVDVEVLGVAEGSKIKWCAKCLGEAEAAYVDSVDYMELPLLSGRTWLTTGTEAHILDRLKNGN